VQRMPVMGQKGQGYSVRCQSEPDIPSRLYGSDVPQGDLTFDFEGPPPHPSKFLSRLGPRMRLTSRCLSFNIS
jgi:hypothetical protein